MKIRMLLTRTVVGDGPLWLEVTGPDGTGEFLSGLAIAADH
jgi:hypothetical protein